MNRVILMGRLGAEPELKMTPSGVAITTLRLATIDGYGDKQKTSWHQVKAFNKLAELCNQYLAKGRQVLLEGRISYNSYEKEGKTAYFTEIIADKIEFVGSAPKDESKSSAQDDSGNIATDKFPTFEKEVQPTFDYSGEDIPF
jgi:single-strand DNA-binding protein